MQSSAQRRAAALAALQKPEALTPVVERTYARMDPAVYSNFEAQFPMLKVQPKNDGEAQFIAGVEYTLRKLRAAILVG